MGEPPLKRKMEKTPTCLLHGVTAKTQIKDGGEGREGGDPCWRANEIRAAVFPRLCSCNCSAYTCQWLSFTLGGQCHTSYCLLQGPQASSPRAHHIPATSFVLLLELFTPIPGAGPLYLRFPRTGKFLPPLLPPHISNLSLNVASWESVPGHPQLVTFYCCHVTLRGGLL